MPQFAFATSIFSSSGLYDLKHIKDPINSEAPIPQLAPYPKR